MKFSNVFRSLTVNTVDDTPVTENVEGAGKTAVRSSEAATSVPVSSASESTSDAPASLAARLGPEEHRLVVATVELFCQRTVHLEHGKVFHQGRELGKPLLLRHDGSFE